VDLVHREELWEQTKASLEAKGLISASAGRAICAVLFGFLLPHGYLLAIEATFTAPCWLHPGLSAAVHFVVSILAMLATFASPTGSACKPHWWSWLMSFLPAFLVLFVFYAAPVIGIYGEVPCGWDQIAALLWTAVVAMSFMFLPATAAGWTRKGWRRVLPEYRYLQFLLDKERPGACCDHWADLAYARVSDRPPAHCSEEFRAEWNFWRSWSLVTPWLRNKPKVAPVDNEIAEYRDTATSEPLGL
jgi:hypothetical protein